MSDLERHLRAARLGDPASLEALATALARAGHRPAPTRHYELLLDQYEGVIMTPGRRFEVLTVDRGRPVTFEVAESLGYGLAFGPGGIWAEAEIASTTLDHLVLREKVRTTGDHGGEVTHEFELAAAPAPLVERRELHGRSSRVPAGTLYEAIGMAMHYAFSPPAKHDADPRTTARDWSDCEPL